MSRIPSGRKTWCARTSGSGARRPRDQHPEHVGRGVVEPALARLRE
ncbi:hypothetical protein ACFPM0_11940 [Pseudonocardia sulfidoxydans]